MGREDEKSYYVTAAKAAEMLDCSRVWVTTLVKKGVLRKKEFPKDLKMYVLKEDVVTYRDGPPNLKQLCARVSILEKQVAFLQNQLEIRRQVRKAGQVLRLNHPDVN